MTTSTPLSQRTTSTPAFEQPPGGQPENATKPEPDDHSPRGFFRRKTTVIAAGAALGILVHLIPRFGFTVAPPVHRLPLLATLVAGGLPLLYDLLRKLLNREFGSDLLGGIAIVTSLILGEYLAGSIIVLMLSGGEASGDRESEVRYLAEHVGITDMHAEQSPEEKLAIVRKETAAARTMYVGDGINDAPAMMAATVGIAIGQNSDVTAKAAGIVIMDNSLRKIDEFMHISRRMRVIALQSAVGGMALSAIGGLRGNRPPQSGERRDRTGSH